MDMCLCDAREYKIAEYIYGKRKSRKCSVYVYIYTYISLYLIWKYFYVYNY